MFATVKCIGIAYHRYSDVSKEILAHFKRIIKRKERTERLIRRITAVEPAKLRTALPHPLAITISFRRHFVRIPALGVIVQGINAGSIFPPKFVKKDLSVE